MLFSSDLTILFGFFGLAISWSWPLVFGEILGTRGFSFTKIVGERKACVVIYEVNNEGFKINHVFAKKLQRRLPQHKKNWVQEEDKPLSIFLNVACFEMVLFLFSCLCVLEWLTPKFHPWGFTKVQIPFFRLFFSGSIGLRPRRIEAKTVDFFL